MSDGSEIVLAALGGTIATTDVGHGLIPTHTGADLLSRVDRSGENIRTVEFDSVPGPGVSLGTVVSLARACHQWQSQGAFGAVITQGTDTIEEVAFALDLLVPSSFPVVVTGAMRGPPIAGTDAWANLGSALAVARSERAKGLGCVVVMNDEIHAARYVRKTHTSNPAAFTSHPPLGPLGWLNEGELNVRFRPTRQQSLDLDVDRISQPAHVSLITVTIAHGSEPIAMSINEGARGLIVQAMGGGHVPEHMVTELTALAGEIPVVLASRTGAGSVLQRTYGFPGSERDLLNRGLIPAGALDGLKARVLLSLLLGAGLSRDVVLEQAPSWFW